MSPQWLVTPARSSGSTDPRARYSRVESGIRHQARPQAGSFTGGSLSTECSMASSGTLMTFS